MNTQMTPLEAMAMQETALRHTVQAEMALQAECQPISTIAYIGAMILGRAAYFAHCRLPQGTVKPYRQLAHAMLAEVLDDVELMMTRTEGRA